MNLEEIQQKIKEKEEKLSQLQRQKKIETISESLKKRKKRAHHLIMLGALFEIAGLDKIEPEILLGYLLEFKKVSPVVKNNYFLTGKVELMRRKDEREKKKKTYIKTLVTK